MDPFTMQQYANERINKARTQADAYRQVRQAREDSDEMPESGPIVDNTGGNLMTTVLTWLRARLITARGSGLS
jgi:hypothetical protein